MTRPYFEVGEEVILASENYPECNGECTVLGTSPPHPTRTDHDRHQWGYYLTIKVPQPASTWAQSALRKKHKPSEIGLKDMARDIFSTAQLLESK